MVIRWKCLAISAEIGIMTYSAFVTVASDVGLMSLAFAEWTVTEDTVVLLGAAQRRGDDFIDWHKTMSWVDLVCTLDAG